MTTANNMKLLSLIALMLAGPVLAADNTTNEAKTAQTAAASQPKSGAPGSDGAAKSAAAGNSDAAKPDSIVSLDIAKTGASVHFNGALSFGKSLFSKVFKQGPDV
jgi:hypothetical protein